MNTLASQLVTSGQTFKHRALDPFLKAFFDRRIKGFVVSLKLTPDHNAWCIPTHHKAYIFTKCIDEGQICFIFQSKMTEIYYKLRIIRNRPPLLLRITVRTHCFLMIMGYTCLIFQSKWLKFTINLGSLGISQDQSK